MKLTSKQSKELEVIRYFIPDNVDFANITEKDIADFFAHSDRGVPHGRNPMTERDGFCALYWGKQRRDLQIAMYLEDWGQTCSPYDFVEEPKAVAEFMSKRMNKPSIMQIWLEENEAAVPQEAFDYGDTSGFEDLIRDSLTAMKLNTRVGAIAL